MNVIVNNRSGICDNELAVVDVVVSNIKKALKENEPISIYIAANLVFFDSFRAIMPYLKEIYEKDLLQKIDIVLGSEVKKVLKEFTFLFKNDSIILSKSDFQFINNLYESEVLDIRVNYESHFNLKLYIFKIGENMGIWSGSADFTNDYSSERIELLVPVNPAFKQDKGLYLDYFMQVWQRSKSSVGESSVIDILRDSSNDEFIQLSARKFISNLLLLMDKEYLVNNISFDLSTMSEFQNMSYYLCIEKLQKNGAAFFLNSIGFSKIYIASMIVNYYRLNDSKVLIINAAETRARWEVNLKKAGIKIEDVTFLKRDVMQKRELELEDFADFNLIIVDKAEYFTISKDSNSRYNNLKRVIESNPEARLLFISDSIINDSLYDLTNILTLLNRGSYVKRFSDYRISERVEMLKEMVEHNRMSNETIGIIVELLSFFSVKIEWSYLSLFLNDEQIDSIDLKKPMITTVKYAYDHEIYVRIYEKIFPVITSLNFEYSKLSFNEYSEDDSLLLWYKWRLYRKIDSSIYTFIQTLKNIQARCTFVKTILKDEGSNSESQFFTKTQVVNIKRSYSTLSAEQQERILANLDNDVSMIVKLLESIEGIKYLENRDDKITNLLKILKSENKPTIIFTECEDTLYYIKRRLNSYGISNLEIIPGGEPTIEGEDRIRLEMVNVEKLCTDFQNGKFDILIANDVIGEDVNLSRADLIINFDMSYNTTILGRRDRKVTSSPGANRKSKVYNFQPDKRIDKESQLFEELGLTVRNLLAFLGIEFFMWCRDVRKVNDLSDDNLETIIYHSRDYKEFLSKKHPDEIKNKFAPSMYSEDITLREFIKYLNISKETLKLTNINFKKPIYTSLKYNENFLYVVYQFNNSIYTLNTIRFSDSKNNSALDDAELANIDRQVFEDLKEQLPGIDITESMAEDIKILGIIKYSES